MTLLTLILALSLLLAGSALAASSDNYQIDWMVPLTGNAGGSASSGNYAASFTVGQTVVGGADSENYSSCYGFWCDVLTFIAIYLPFVLKN